MATLFRNATIITMNPAHMIIEQGSFGIAEDKIIYVGPHLIDTKEYDHVVELSGQILMPGLINTHGHTPLSLLRGVANDLSLNDWLKTIWPLEEKFTADDIYWGTRLSMLEMLRCGTTCFMDMYDHMDVVAEAVMESGMRASLARGVIGLCSKEVQRQKLTEAKSFAQRWQSASSRITVMMSPHAPYTCPPDFLKKIVAIAQELSLPIHTHMSETAQEVAQSVKDYGMRPPAYLAQYGVFDCPTLVAHAVHLTDEEIDLLAKYQVRVAHNPISNLKLGAGIARVSDLLQKNIAVSLGTDSAASNNNLNLFEEMKMAALLQKGIIGDATAIPAITALQMATINGAKSLCIDHLTGSLEVGKYADFIIIATDRPHFQPFHDPIAHLVYAASGNDVTDVYVAGKALVANGEYLSLDSNKIMCAANQRFSKLLTS